MELSRRDLLASAAAGAGAMTFGPGFLREALAAPAVAGASPYGPLTGPDANNVMLPQGFSSRIIAKSNEAVAGTNYVWPVNPDAEATFRTKDGGWILVTNHEAGVPSGGSSATRFRADGSIADAYRILPGTQFNCAGGPTPWGTWLSGEEHGAGLIHEADPAGVLPAQARPALGTFQHEAACVDPVGGRIYMTEDNNPAGFYRFTPTRYPDLTAGLLEVAQVAQDGKVSWLTVPDPSTAQTGTRTFLQVPGATVFMGAEGIWYSDGVCYFTTKIDIKVWAYTIETQTIEILYDRSQALDSSLDAVDNVTVSPMGEVLICEDGGNMEIGLITTDRKVAPLVQFVGPDHNGSELCGVVFSPDGTRLYVTSQRAFGNGAVYEISGPFRIPATGVPGDLVYGPPAGELRPNGPLNPGGDFAGPQGALKAASKIKRKALLKDGLTVTLELDEIASVSAVLDSDDLAKENRAEWQEARPKNVVLARATAEFGRNQGPTKIVLLPDKAGRKALKKNKGKVRARVLVSAVDILGNERVLTRKLKIGEA